MTKKHAITILMLSKCYWNNTIKQRNSLVKYFIKLFTNKEIHYVNP